MKHARILVLATLVLFMTLVLHRESRTEAPSPFVNLYSLHSASSGTFVERNLILSCAHGKTDDQCVTVTLADGRRLRGKVVWISQSKDLSLIETARTPPVTPMKIAEMGRPWPAAVQLFGFGGTGKLHQHQAMVRDRSQISHTWRDGSPNPNWNSYLRLSGHSQPGDSGGAVVAEDRIVGVITGCSNSKARDGSMHYHTVCVPIDVIWTFLDEWEGRRKDIPSSHSD